eukprot:CAMPEP_0197456856 /NCGR_PEP_ID=MMETSP1175-20131217/44481_1 /TAXON_ID=1003142 /ORGANISM="Triceratium dubium, Strain CCMP147" /LENGTH=79 /DNA_ID=CAMNT_0042991047 /DNA_START=303 /DNA_END=542 /DNA_ORIENTATION=-
MRNAGDRKKVTGLRMRFRELSMHDSNVVWVPAARWTMALSMMFTKGETPSVTEAATMTSPRSFIPKSEDEVFSIFVFTE